MHEVKPLTPRDAAHTILQAIQLWWADWSNQLVVSLLAILLSLTVVLYPAALFGVYAQATDLTHDLRTGMAGFWAGFKKYLRPASIWGLVNSLGVAVFAISIWFYGNSHFTFAPLFVWISLLALIFWVSWQYLSVACFFLQEPQTLPLAWRNGLALLLLHPFYLLPVGLFLAGLTFLSLRYFIPLIIGGEALLVIVSLKAVQATISPPYADSEPVS